jgi:hypothetical protein
MNTNNVNIHEKYEYEYESWRINVTERTADVASLRNRIPAHSPRGKRCNNNASVRDRGVSNCLFEIDCGEKIYSVNNE